MEVLSFMKKKRNRINLYDLRIIYTNYKEHTPSSFLFKIGAIAIIDQIADVVEKTETLTNTLRIFATMEEELIKAPTPDYKYFNTQDYGSEERRVALNELKKVKPLKTVDVIFEFMELTTSPIMIYFYENCVGRPCNYSLASYQQDLSRLMRYLSSEKLPHDVSNIVNELEYRKAELDNLSRIKDEVSSSAKQQATDSIEHMRSRLTDLGKEIDKVESELKESVNSSFMRVRAEVDSLIDIRVNQVKELQSQIETMSLTLRRQVKDIRDSINTVKTGISTDELMSIRGELSSLLTQIQGIKTEDELENQIAEIRRMTNRVSMEIVARKPKADSKEAMQNLNNILADVRRLSQTATECQLSVESISKDLPALSNVVESLVTELNSYKVSVLSTQAKISEIKRRTI